MNERTGKRTNGPTILKFTWHIRYYDSMRLRTCGSSTHTIHFHTLYMRTHLYFSHGNENGCLTHVTFIISCDLFLRLQFQVPVSVLTHFLAHPLQSLALSVSLIHHFLCPYTLCQSLFFFSLQTKNYPTPSVIPCIRAIHSYTRRNLMYNMLTDCFPSVIYFHSFWFFFRLSSSLSSSSSSSSS